MHWYVARRLPLQSVVRQKMLGDVEELAIPFTEWPMKTLEQFFALHVGFSERFQLVNNVLGKTQMPPLTLAKWATAQYGYLRDWEAMRDFATAILKWSKGFGHVRMRVDFDKTVDVPWYQTGLRTLFEPEPTRTVVYEVVKTPATGTGFYYPDGREITTDHKYVPSIGYTGDHGFASAAWDHLSKHALEAFGRRI